MTNPSTTPASITPFIAKCAKQISNHDPVYLDLVSYPAMVPSMCFENVDRLVKQHGGKAIMGWLFWEWPGVMVDAEHHAVWQKPDETWEDVTPKADGETRILFVRDDRATYQNQKSILNKRFAAPGNALAKEFIVLKREAENVIEPYRRTGSYGVPGDVLERKQKKDFRAKRRWKRLLDKYAGTPSSAV